MSIPPFGRGFSRHRGLPTDVVSLRSAEAKPPRSVHRPDEPTELSLSMVASPQCRFRLARQNQCSAAATNVVNFRMRRHSAKDGYKVQERRISGVAAKSFRVGAATVKVNLA